VSAVTCLEYAGEIMAVFMEYKYILGPQKKDSDEIQNFKK
jgi:hypothetical protein